MVVNIPGLVAEFQAFHPSMYLISAAVSLCVLGQLAADRNRTQLSARLPARTNGLVNWQHLGFNQLPTSFYGLSLGGAFAYHTVRRIIGSFGCDLLDSGSIAIDVLIPRTANNIVFNRSQ